MVWPALNSLSLLPPILALHLSRVSEGCACPLRSVVAFSKELPGASTVHLSSALRTLWQQARLVSTLWLTGSAVYCDSSHFCAVCSSANVSEPHIVPLTCFWRCTTNMHALPKRARGRNTSRG